MSAPANESATAADTGGTAAAVLAAAGWAQSTPSTSPSDTPTRRDLLTELEGTVTEATATVARLSGLVDRMTHLRGQIAEQPAQPSANLAEGDGC